MIRLKHVMRGSMGRKLPAEGSVTRTLPRYNAKVLAGRRRHGHNIQISSELHTNYLENEIGGGATTTFGEDTRSIEIHGFSRRLIGPQGKVKRKQSIHTLRPIVIEGSRAEGNRHVVDGSIQHDFNLAQFSMVSTVNGLKWSDECCYPNEGIASIELTGSKNAKIEADFNSATCGEVTYTKTKDAEIQTKTVLLSACE